MRSRTGLFVAVITLAGLTPAAAQIKVGDAEITGGKLVISGSTAKPDQSVMLDDNFKTTSDRRGRFTFRLDYLPSSCISTVKSGQDSERVVIGRCGPAGAQGQKGDAGPAGAAGPIGAAGPAGAAGARGEAGMAGAAGARGEAGPKGDTGSAGAAGARGEAGLKGDAGPAGPAGPAGAQGSAGPAGPPGPPGAMGARGEAGPAGPSGEAAAKPQ